MDTLGRGVGQGGAPSPTGSLCWPEKVPPAGVGFLSVRQPTHWGDVPTGGGGFGEIHYPKTFKGRHRRSIVARNHPPDRQADGDGNPKPESVGLGELERLLCHNGTPGCSSPRADS